MVNEICNEEQKPIYWSVFEGFDFLLNLAASDKEQATGLALAKLGWSAESCKFSWLVTR